MQHVNASLHQSILTRLPKKIRHFLADAVTRVEQKLTAKPCAQAAFYYPPRPRPRPAFQPCVQALLPHI